MSEKEYRDKEALHYSMLATLDKNPNRVFEPEELKPGYGLIFGDITDILITGDKEAVNDKYYVIGTIGLSDNIKSIVEYLFVNGKDIDSPEDVREAANACGYGTTYKIGTVVSKVAEGKRYLDSLKEAGDKIIIDKSILDKAESAAETFKTHEFTKDIFNESNLEVIYQKEIYWFYRGYDCKALLDMIHVDHVNKIVYPYDIKTTGKSVFEFPFTIMKYRYYIQAAWYTLALTYEYPDYKIENFKFVVINNEYPTLPLVYKCSDNMLEVGADGGKYNGREIKGYTELINEYTWHLNSNKYKYSKELYDTNGEILLDVFDYEEN